MNYSFLISVVIVVLAVFAFVRKYVDSKDLKVIRNKNDIPKKEWKSSDIMGQFK